MTRDEFIAKHKRLFVALAAYGWEGVDNDPGVFFMRKTTRMYQIICDGTYSYPFSLGTVYVWDTGRHISRRYRHESSVLAALAKIHTGQVP